MEGNQVMFTKGPWIAGKEIQLDDDGIQTVPIFGPEGPGWGRVGTAYAEIGRDDELWPNARLIAAAPEQHGELQTIANLVKRAFATQGWKEALAKQSSEADYLGPILHEILDRAEVAIAKAEISDG